MRLRLHCQQLLVIVESLADGKTSLYGAKFFFDDIGFKGCFAWGLGPSRSLPPFSVSIGADKFQGYNRVSNVLVVYPSTNILSCHTCCRYSLQPRPCDTCIKKIICIVFNINFFFWWESIVCYVLFLLYVVPKWPVVLPPMPHQFLHLAGKHVHAFDHCKIPSWYLQVMFRISLCKTMKSLGIIFSYH